MELTEKERLFLINQYEILKKLDPDEEEYYEKDQKILIQGLTKEYDSLVDGLHNETPIEVCNEVIDILQMYRSLYFSYLKLSDIEKAEIDEDDVKFQGFDGNEEGSHHLYVEYIIEDDDRFTEFKDVELNSHWNKLSKYREMIVRWRKYHRYNLLTIEKIKDILDVD